MMWNDGNALKRIRYASIQNFFLKSKTNGKIYYLKQDFALMVQNKSKKQVNN